MKRLHRILGLGVFVALALGMSSCFILGDLSDSLKEIAEVMEGKVFTIRTATVTYSDSTTLSFADYGKKQRIEKGTEVLIYIDSTYYALNTEEKTGYKYHYSGEYLFNTAYCFLEETWKLANYNENVKKSSETIAGKKCTVYTDSEDGSKYGGWERISFVMNDVRATSFTTSVSSSAFTVPTDYTITDMTDSTDHVE
ncbi:MAG: hypothetical protein H6543_01815 [Prevotellaceae bacterium]|nr:hypothetical protein [Prevotellaceae bacterium]